MMTRLSIFVIAFLISSTLFSQLPANYSSQNIQTDYGPGQPMGTLFNADGTKMFVWTYSGRIYVSNWNGTSYVKQATPVLDISSEVLAWRDFGMLSVVLDPDFDTNGLIYMFYAVDRIGTDYNPTPVFNTRATISRLTRYQLNHQADPMTTNYDSRFVLIGETITTGIPILYESHAGGSMVFGADGTLIVTTGDNASYSATDIGGVSHTYQQQAISEGIMRPEENVGAMRSQMVNSLCGKVLRLDPETGDGVPSNPFYDSSNPRSAPSRLWSLGFRNPFRMSIDTSTGSTNPDDANPGTLFVVDVGWNVWEDLHIIDRPGLNAGWPLYEGQTTLSSYYNSGATNPDEGNQLFRDLCMQPTSFVDNSNPALRRFTHNRPEVAWRHGGTDDARVPWFSGTTPTDPRVGTVGSPTTGVQFRGNTGVSGVFIDNCGFGPNYEGKYFFTDYVRNFINVATLNDGSLNWISNISEFAPANFGNGIVHMSQNPRDGSIFYANIFNGYISRLSFNNPANPTWTNEPQNLTVECSDDSTDDFTTWLNSFSGIDQCGNTATLTNDSSGLSDEYGNTGSETVTFTLTTMNGTFITKVATFTIQDTTDPTFNEALPSDITVECDAIPTAPTLTASDICGSSTVDFSEITTGTCDTLQIVRTWTATDECGNETVHTQTISVEDTTAPNFNEALPSNITVECDAIPTAVTLTANDNCGSATVDFEEVTTGSCDTLQILRTWTATDDCGNETVHTQTISVEDTTAPTFNEALPSDITVECNAIPTTVTLTANDNCSSASVDFSEITTGTCDTLQIVRTWTATDDCGNETVHTQTISVEDTTAPNFNEALPSNITLECDAIPTAVTLTANDNCGSATVDFEEVTTGSCDTLQIVRTWTATDDCGNETVHTQTISVEDTTAPTFNEALPTDVTVECDAIPTTVTLTANDNCSSASVDFSEITTGTCDTLQIVRTWTATDDCGNETVHTQTISVEDTTAPNFNEALPSNITVECDAIPTAVTLTANDNCGSATVDFEEVTTGSCDTLQILRTWTATDDCGNETVHTQTISVEDTTAPTFNEALPTDITVECDAIPTAPTLTASDTCGSSTVDFSEITTGTCDTLQIVRTWTATDECGNETVHTQTTSVEDTTAPTFNEALPTDITVECDAIPTAPTLTASDTCGSSTVDFSEITTGTCDTLQIVRTWTATDECGNETVHTQTISVEDTTNPVWNDTPSDILVECSTTSNEEFIDWLNSFSGTDNCGSAIVTHNSSGVLTCGNSATVTFTLTDDCGNFITMDTTFTIDDTLSLNDPKDEKLTLYPNPSFDYIIIKGLKQTAKLTVFNLSGQIVWKTEAQNGQPVYFNLASGMYMLKIDTAHTSEIKKLIVE